MRLTKHVKKALKFDLLPWQPVDVMSRPQRWSQVHAFRCTSQQYFLDLDRLSRTCYRISLELHPAGRMFSGARSESAAQTAEEETQTRPPYVEDPEAKEPFKHKYVGKCYCGAVEFAANSDPVVWHGF